MRTAIFAGSFDPMTNGHRDVMRAGLALADRLIVAVGSHPTKTPMFSMEERFALIAEVAEELDAHDRVEPLAFSGLLVDAARSHGASILLRGLRDSADFAYEMQLAGMNGTMANELETVLIPARPQSRHITATLVRQIAAMGGDISAFVPQPVARAIAEKRSA